MIFKPGLLNNLTVSSIRKILNLLISLIGVIHRVRFERILPPRILGRRISKSKKHITYIIILLIMFFSFNIKV